MKAALREGSNVSCAMLPAFDAATMECCLRATLQQCSEAVLHQGSGSKAGSIAQRQHFTKAALHEGSVA